MATDSCFKGVIFNYAHCTSKVVWVFWFSEMPDAKFMMQYRRGQPKIYAYLQLKIIFEMFYKL